MSCFHWLWACGLYQVAIVSSSLWNNRRVRQWGGKRKRNHGTWHTIRFSVDRLYILCDPLSMLLRQRGRINDESIQNDTIANFSRKGDHNFGTFFFLIFFIEIVVLFQILYVVYLLDASTQVKVVQRWKVVKRRQIIQDCLPLFMVTGELAYLFSLSSFCKESAHLGKLVKTK